MNTHTPGPWTIDTSYDARSGPHTYIQREYDGDGVTGIAGIYTIAEVADQAFLPDGVQEANARLIAAAPDLLAACRLACLVMAKGNGLSYVDRREAHEAVIAAIRKAEGGT